jgi:hypothetical protein
MTFSDHASFWANGYDALLIGETVEDDNPLHTPGDTLGNLDFAFFTASTRAAAVLAARLAGAEILEPGEAARPAWVPYPNPSRGVLSIPLAGSGEGPASIAVYDIAGRLVRELLVPGAGRCTPCFTEWDGQDQDGRRVGPGAYFLRMRVDGAEMTKKVLIVR